MNFIEMLADNKGDLIPFVAIVGGLGIAVIAILAGTISGMVNSRDRERTRREIAAYIAEGSMSPEEGERLINAKDPKA